jgi:4-amino-4-deoxy-L-arabinose transferase-like glycosyltransferase
MNNVISTPLARKVHSAFWWTLLILFTSLVVAEAVFDLSGSKLHLYGVLMLALLTVIRAVVVAIELNRRGERAGVGWSIAMIFALGLAVLVGVVL